MNCYVKLAVTLTYDPLTMKVRSIYWIWIWNMIDKLLICGRPITSRAILGGGAQLIEARGLRGTWTQLHQTWQGHRAIIAALHFISVSECWYLAALSTYYVENDAKFRTFWAPPLWKLGDAWARSIYQLLKLYLRLNLQSTFEGHPLRGCWSPWIDKK